MMDRSREVSCVGSRDTFEEVADIGIIVLVRDRGFVRVRKIALLQSKRLYPDEQASKKMFHWTT
jgi:hypothetical protein